MQDCTVLKRAYQNPLHIFPWHLHTHITVIFFFLLLSLELCPFPIIVSALTITSPPIMILYSLNHLPLSILFIDPLPKCLIHSKATFSSSSCLVVLMVKCALFKVACTWLVPSRAWPLARYNMNYFDWVNHRMSFSKYNIIFFGSYLKSAHWVKCKL